MSMPQTISCAICEKSEPDVRFSKRQQKLAIKGEAAKCAACIQQHQEEQQQQKQQQEELDETEVVHNEENKNQKKQPQQLLEPTSKAKQPSPAMDATPSQDSAVTKRRRSEESEVSKQNDPTIVASFNEALAPETPNDLDRPVPKKARRRPRLESTDDDDDDGDSDFGGHRAGETPDVNVTDLKRQILGRDLNVSPPPDNNNAEDQDLLEIRNLFRLSAANGSGSTQAASSHAGLQVDLHCAICQELSYPPVSLHCGHSFCQDCLAWWWKTSPTCPTCRQTYGKNQKLPSVNVALKKCIVVLFGPQLVDRIKTRKQATAGEDGGAHNRGYEVLSPLTEEYWHSIRARPLPGTNRGLAAANSTIKARRNIVLDANDQRMQLALSLRLAPQQTENGLHVWITLLTMEEDEASDSGFPIRIQNAEDEHFICAKEDRFAYTSLAIKMTKEEGSNSHKAPVGRVAKPNADGDFVYRLEANTCSNHHEARSLLFVHEETGATMELDLSMLKRGAGGGTFRPLEERVDNDEEEDDEEEEKRCNGNELEYEYERGEDDDEEEENEDMDRFEDDGFLVDGDDSEMEGEFSGEDDSDVCYLCKEGGELMVCDGGKEMDGCGKAFHYKCTGRTVLPEGDWVCSECALSGGISTKRQQGHEFPVPTSKKMFAGSDSKPLASARGRSGRTLDDESSDEDELVLVNKNNFNQDSDSDEEFGDDKPPSKPEEEQKNAKRRIIEDSSDEEENSF